MIPIQTITVCWCKQPILKIFQTCLYCIYLLKLYDKSIFINTENGSTLQELSDESQISGKR